MKNLKKQIYGGVHNMVSKQIKQVDFFGVGQRDVFGNVFTRVYGPIAEQVHTMISGQIDRLTGIREKS